MFWTHTIWYLVLSMVTIIEIVVIFATAKKRRRELFAFLITIFGLTLFIESTILIFMKSYTYYPMILHHTRIPYDDVLAGNLFSQSSISATLLLVTVRNLKFYWYFVIAVIYGLIEEFFIFLGIYSHNWYQTWITIVMLPLGFWVTKYLYLKIIHCVKPFFYYGCILIGLFPLNIITLNWFFMLTGLQDMSFNVLSDPISSRHFIVLLLFFPLAATMMFIHFSRLRFVWRALIFIILYALYFLAYQYHFIWIKEGWFWVVSSLTIFWMYLSTMLLDWLYGKPLGQGLKT